MKVPRLFNLFAKLRKPRKRVLIIKTDAIGDYVLFRNFIKVVKKSAAFKGYEIDLLGNSLWKDIALKYDGEFVNEFFFVNAESLYDSPLKTFKLGWRLFIKNYQTVLQPTYARTFIGDGLAALTASKHIIGFESDTERINPKYKAKTDKFYTRKLALPADISFEFYKSVFFFENVLNEKLTINGPAIDIQQNKKEGIVIFPGAGVVKRSWEADKFLALIKLIIAQTSQPVYLVGGPGEIETGNYLTTNLPDGAVQNLTGKTTLIQLIELINNSALVIANETSAIHIAAATKTPSVCILGGGHFGRFTPYPNEIQYAPVCVFEKMDCYYCNWNCIYKTAENEPYPCISTITIENVWAAVKQLL